MSTSQPPTATADAVPPEPSPPPVTDPSTPPLPGVVRIVYLDRSAVRAVIRPPSFPHEWLDYASSSPFDVVPRLLHAAIAITSRTPITATHLSQLPHLRLIAVAATGYDCVDLSACILHGITVTNIRQWAVTSLSQHAFALILALRRQLLLYRQRVFDGAWKLHAHVEPTLPIDLTGSTLGVIGCGAQGTHIAALGTAFGMHTLLAERRHSPHPPRPGRTPFLDVLRAADVLSLNCPLTADTRGMIGKEELRMMKPTALLIDCSRGGVVDGHALAWAVQEGVIAGAGVDVLEEEPPSEANPLVRLRLPNLIVTPHCAWASQRAVEVLVEQLVECMEAFQSGHPINVVGDTHPSVQVKRRRLAASPSTPSSSFPFHQLPPALFSHITQWLSLPAKLLHLTHLSRTSPPLNPASFACDTVAWTPSLLTRLLRDPFPPPSHSLLHLLSHTPSAVYVGQAGSALDPLCGVLQQQPTEHIGTGTGIGTPPFSPSPPSTSLSTSSPSSLFPGLRAVALLLDGVDPWPVPHLGLQCPDLQALELLLPLPLSPLPSPLPVFPSLRVLRLRARLSSSELVHLLCLPLTSLDLLACDVDCARSPSHTTLSLPSPCSLRTLLLPKLSVAWEQAVLSSLTVTDTVIDPQATHGGGVQSPRGLERLWLSSVQAAHLSYISRLHQLHTLRLYMWDDEWHPEPDHVADWLSQLTTTTSLLPQLRHLHVEHRGERVPTLHPVWTGVAEDRGLTWEEWADRLFTIIPAFLVAYSAQLHSLDVQLHYSERDERDIAYEPRRQLTAALLSCRELRSLKLDSWWLALAPATSRPASPSISTWSASASHVAAPSASAASLSPSLPHLEALLMDFPLGVDEATLALLLDAAPHLQELTLGSGPLFSFDVLPWVGERCHQLRTLRLTETRPSTGGPQHPYSMTPHRWLTSPHTPPALPLLTSLLFYRAPVDLYDGPHVSAADLSRLFSYLAHSAPSLRCLHLGYDLHNPDEHRHLLSLLAPLTYLRALSMGMLYGAMQGEWKRYWQQRVYTPARRLVERRARESTGESVWAEAALPKVAWGWRKQKEWSMEGELSRDSMRVGAMQEEEVWDEDMPRMPCFVDQVDGVDGASAFFAAHARAYPTPQHAPSV